MNVETHTCAHTHPTLTPRLTRSHIHMPAADKHIYAHIYTRAHIYGQPHSHTGTQAHIYARRLPTCTHMYIRAHRHTYPHSLSLSHSHTHTHTHTHVQAPLQHLVTHFKLGCSYFSSIFANPYCLLLWFFPFQTVFLDFRFPSVLVAEAAFQQAGTDNNRTACLQRTHRRLYYRTATIRSLP